MQNISKTIHSPTTNGLSLTLNQSHNSLGIALNNGYEQNIQSLKLNCKNFPTSTSPLIQFDKFNPQQVNIYPNSKLTNISLNGQNLQNFDFENFTSFTWIINDQIVRGIRGYCKEFDYFEIKKSLQFRSECLNYDNKKVVNLLKLLIDKGNRLIIEDDNNIPIIFFNLNTIELIKNCEEFNIESINYSFRAKQIIYDFNIKEQQTINNYKLTFDNINILKLTKLKNNTSLLNIESIKLNFNKNNQLLYFNKFKLEIYLKLIKQLCKTKREGDSSDDDDEDSVNRGSWHKLITKTKLTLISI
ncbi:hypothetical protein CONCODRAFT_18740 [Conidiobolus coronatus NRRL 28638]|uniref:Uncharacterized protein n=1 Tax=Conidiobolus coronatus (strain ATCC 28846 / CBS 209.66 / NRRL 28638) TaxID=796925 RepID=A0A137P1I2_CONC2|nr:hypothetical protein CONCODRAFT_18740 [Conidiobolus coronatus NRRL 28638]|eukprot:KXN68872.1 hypothetical protein CONCODRAFT_18740 [Conidiobolus coronatus NRRL 28638]